MSAKMRCTETTELRQITRDISVYCCVSETYAAFYKKAPQSLDRSKSYCDLNNSARLTPIFVSNKQH
jgi:hypothetical protein